MLKSWDRLKQSRKFWLMAWTAIGAAALLTVSQFAPQYSLFVEKLLAIIAPVIIALIIGITIEDAAAKIASGHD